MKQFIIATCIVLIVITLSGCAGISQGLTGTSAGMSSYNLEHIKKDGSKCKVQVTSGRELGNKGKIEITKECGVKASISGGLTGQEAQIKTLEVIDNVIDRVPLP